MAKKHYLKKIKRNWLEMGRKVVSDVNVYFLGRPVPYSCENTALTGEH